MRTSKRRRINYGRKSLGPWEPSGSERVQLSAAESCGIQVLFERGLHGLDRGEVIERIVAEYLEARPDLMAEVRRRFAGARMGNTI